MALPRGYNLFMLNPTEHGISINKKINCYKIYTFLALKLSYAVFAIPINVEHEKGFFLIFGQAVWPLTDKSCQ